MAGLYERDIWLCLGDAPGAYFVGLDLAGFESGGPSPVTACLEARISWGSTPDEDGLVLLAQLTTPGEIKFEANVKIQLGRRRRENLSVTIPAIGPGGCVDAGCQLRERGRL